MNYFPTGVYSFKFSINIKYSKETTYVRFVGRTDFGGGARTSARIPISRAKLK